MKVNYSMWLMVTFILNKLIWGRRVTLSVDEQQLILVYQSLTLRPTSHLGTWVVVQTECPGRSRWSRGSWRPNPHLTLPQSVPSSLSALWVLQHYNSPFLGFVDEVNIIYNVIFFEYNFIIQQIKIVWEESHFQTYMSRLLVQERDKRANTYACISLKSFNMSFHNLYLNALRRDPSTLAFMMAKFLMSEK